MKEGITGCPECAGSGLNRAEDEVCLCCQGWGRVYAIGKRKGEQMGKLIPPGTIFQPTSLFVNPEKVFVCVFEAVEE